MTQTTDTYTLLRAFADELVRCGMRAACTSPGSRSTPLVLSLAREPRLRCYSHVDERCSGFFALGLAKASARPVAVVCTSGTAAAELAPAVIEAHDARVPLVVLTADRPWELRENGAGQAIDQLKLYGGAAKWFFEVGVHEAGAQQLRWMRTLACRAYWTTLEGRPGAVHLNFPLREPLVIDGEPPADDSGRADGRPYVGRAFSSAAGAVTGTGEELLSELVSQAKRGIVIAGRDERLAGMGEAAAAFAAARGWPLLADPLSGARRGDAAIAHYDALLRDDTFAASLAPDLILRVGDLPVSKPLRSWLAGLSEVRQVALDPEGAWQDPASVLSDSLALDPAVALRRLMGASTHSAAPHHTVDEAWLASWRSADKRASEAILGALGDEHLSEPTVAAELGLLLPEQSTLFVASSMPVRDIETFWPVRSDPPRVLCNRGANGIDGTVSSAFGAAAAAAAGPGPVVLLIGDVALDLKLTIVLIDNDGGGIFDFLPVAETPTDIYTHHVATPTGLDFAHAAVLYGLVHERVQTVSGFRGALERALEPEAASRIVHVRSERTSNVELHRRVWRAVSAALRET
jgi:2-succinyl-5-enolpyruvyl-6-hydroxy-3-cyclohexene-1-carboxylate synthase